MARPGIFPPGNSHRKAAFIRRAALFMHRVDTSGYLTAAFFNVTIAVWLSLVATTTRTGDFSVLIVP